MLESFKLEQEKSRLQRAKETEIEAKQMKEELEKMTNIIPNFILTAEYAHLHQNQTEKVYTK